MINSLDKIIQDAVDRGVLQQHTSDKKISSSEVHIDGIKYLNFGSCSYLGLEHSRKLKEAVKNATEKFGTQFSTSRTYLSIGLYEELESSLYNMFKKPALVTASTTLGHLSALPIIVEEGDVVILDLQVHSSIQMSAQLLKANKTPIHIIPHNDMDALEKKIKLLNEKANKIWYMADGVYSMYGDFAPLKKIQSLLNKYKKLHLYIDDAHGMGWTGEQGIGYVRSQMEHHDKMVLASSLNKSFAASGGVLLFPNEEMYRKVKNCGSTMIFSGPIQPPMLGAGIASAELHQSTEFKDLQDEFEQKIAFTNHKLSALGLPQYARTNSPLFFIPVGLPSAILNIIKRMKRKGYYLNSAGFPATPMKKGGLRFMINNKLTIEDIDQMLTTLKQEYISGLNAEGSSPEEVTKQFKIAPFINSTHKEKEKKKENKKEFTEFQSTSIKEMDSQEWNSLFSKHGSNVYQNLKQLEQVFKGNKELENNWEIKYHTIRDAEGKIILASVYTIALMMDDLLAEKTLSGKIKELRKKDRLYLTSKNILTGTPFTKGKSVYIDYENKHWKEALKSHVNLLQDIADKNEVSNIMLREFCGLQKTNIERLLMNLGLLEVELPENLVVDDMTWENTDELLSRLSHKYRYSLRKEILKKESQFQVSFSRPSGKHEQEYTFELYRNVHNQSTEISVFELPYKLFQKMYTDPSYDFIYLYIKDVSEKPVAVMVSQIIDNIYNAQLVGLDYNYVRTQGSYKQILYQTVKRAKYLGCEKIDLAYTAGMEKKKVGAKPKNNFGFAMALEHDSYAEMQSLK
jgi:7-keto-8-aminopelargonate synthetase-like enzyme